MSGQLKSAPELLRGLWEERFFEHSRTLPEITERLAASGYHLTASTLGVALIRSVRTGRYLLRTGRLGKWVYTQKHPFSAPSAETSEMIVQYEFHPRIKEVSLTQFKNKDFKSAILNAFIEVVTQVKVKTGHPKDKNGKDLDGDDLMNRIFGCDGIQVPTVKFNTLADGLDRAEQRGLMYLYKGVVGVRDKKAHLNFIQNDPLKTIEYLSLASLLLRLLDENPATEA